MCYPMRIPPNDGRLPVPFNLYPGKVYNVDAFNELTPANSSVEYLASVGRAVYGAMASDPRAVWLMQGWMFMFDKEFWGPAQVEALLTSVPRGSMIVLDLDSTDREEYTRPGSYHGQPFIFNMIHTFGGQLAMFGRKDHVNERPEEARRMVNSTMVGIGMAMEGIHNSYVMYELLSEMSWRDGPIEDMDAWFVAYSTRRYGQRNDLAGRAWQLLGNSVYSSEVGQMTVVGCHVVLHCYINSFGCKQRIE